MSYHLVKNFDGHDVRVIGTTESPMFVAADVCAVLGLQNTSQAIDSLDADEKGLCFADTLGGSQKVLAVTESGLYHLIFKSRKESAKRFRRWVTEEVLPAIRKTGSYVVAESIDERAEKVTNRMMSALDQLIRRGVPPQAAAGCISNVFKDSVRTPSAYAQPQTASIQ